MTSAHVIQAAQDHADRHVVVEFTCGASREATLGISNPSLDYAFLTLSDPLPGHDRTAPLIRAFSPDSVGSTVLVAGYPADRPGLTVSAGVCMGFTRTAVFHNAS